jgi:septal ring factor EnvC (AmiA/AmiB activator)
VTRSRELTRPEDANNEATGHGRVPEAATLHKSLKADSRRAEKSVREKSVVSERVPRVERTEAETREREDRRRAAASAVVEIGKRPSTSVH